MVRGKLILGQNRKAFQASQIRKIIRRSTILVSLWPMLLAAAPVAMDAESKFAHVLPAHPISVSRLVIRLLPGLQPAAGEVLDEAVRARLHAARGPPPGAALGPPGRRGGSGSRRSALPAPTSGSRNGRSCSSPASRWQSERIG